MKATLPRREIEADPHLLWNRFVDFLVYAELTDLETLQRPPFLAFWYDSEVQNGGHLQFFLNRPHQPMVKTISALEALGAYEQASVLRRALDLLPPPGAPGSVRDFRRGGSRGAVCRT